MGCAVLRHPVSLVWFIGYLVPNPVYTYILNVWFVNTFSDTQLNDQTVLFVIIQVSLSKQS